MQETIEEKEIICWMAGFYDAEGCFRINKSVRKNNYITYSPRAIINNTDIDTIDYIRMLLLGKYGINCYVRDSSPTTIRRTVRYIEVSRITKVIELCDLLLPYIIGKYDELVLLKNFCISRRDRFIENGIKNNKLDYTPFEKNLYDQLVDYKAHKKGRKCLEFKPIVTPSPNNISWCWLAGYTDGDGSFSINKKGSASYCVATTNPNVDEKLNDFFLRNNISFYHSSQLPSKNHLVTCKKRIFKYFVHDTKDILTIINNIKKYLISKDKMADVMLEYCNNRLDRKGKWRTNYEKEFVGKLGQLTQ